jgi:uncharacterized membrane protein
MTLLILMSLLLIPAGLLAGLKRLGVINAISSAVPYRVGASHLFVFTGIGHFALTEEMALILGAAVSDPIPTVQITGILEIAGAIGIWFPKWRRSTGQCLIAMLIAFLPFNVYAAIQHVPFGGHEYGPIYLLVRIPFQFLLIWWIGKATDATTGCSVNPFRAEFTASLNQ